MFLRTKSVRTSDMSLVAIFLIVSFALLACANDTPTSSSQNKNPYSYFSTRTAYNVVRGDIVRPAKNCEPVQIWMLARHGTRYPSKSEIKNIQKLIGVRDSIIKNHRKRAGTLQPDVLKKLRDWRLDPDLKIDSAKKLAPQGKQDLYRLAQRLRKVFPKLLQVDAHHVKPRDFVFRATNTQRTQESMKAFAQGLFEIANEVVTPEEPPTNDTLLESYTNCLAWESRYWEDHYDAESNKFSTGSEVTSMLIKIKHRLGFDQTFDYDTVRAMYNLCRFETAWYPHVTSIWCALFTKNDFEILEYQEDLDHYYYCGPGRPWNAELGCNPLKDMFTRFKEIVDGANLKNHAKGVFYFAHTVTLQTLMAALGIDGGSSKPLLAAEYSKSGNRKFRTSLLGAFATNIIAVLSKCTGSKSPYAVSFYTAEKLEHIDGCKAGLCDWNFFVRKFSQQVNTCSMDFC